jgi:hypothetical protein
VGQQLGEGMTQTFAGRRRHGKVDCMTQHSTVPRAPGQLLNAERQNRDSVLLTLCATL